MKKITEHFGNSDEVWLQRELDEAGETYTLVDLADKPSVLKTIDSSFSGIWDRYPMNCVYVEDERQFSIQWRDSNELQVIIDELAQAWSGEALLVLEPPGDRPTINVAFVFNTFAETVRCAFDYAINFSIFDRQASFLVVKNGHLQVIGNGHAAWWLRSISERHQFWSKGQ
jgi:hypothetical protein